MIFLPKTQYSGKIKALLPSTIENNCSVSLCHHQVAVMRKAKDNKEESRMVMLPVEEVEKYVTEIEEEKEKEAAAKRPAEKTSD